MTGPSAEKADAFQGASDLLSSECDDRSLRYATLEIRRCLEAVVYEKLWAYRDRIPADVARRWQPTHAFKALIAVEPDAGVTKSWSIRPQETAGVPGTGPWRPMGEDRRPRPRWLTKTYNKLGSYLHASYPYQKSKRRSSAEEHREFLAETLNALEPYVGGALTMNLAELVTVESCAGCKLPVVGSVSGVEETGHLICLNPECEIRYRSVGSGRKLSFEPEFASLRCLACDEEIKYPLHLLRLGHTFGCHHCSTRHEVTPGYNLLAESDPSD